jgi:HEPN domain-containing protein
MDETIRGKQADQTLMWIRWVDADYLGARLLLVEGLLIQGTVLANTAIEKYLKAICSYANIAIPGSHDVATLYANIKHKTPTNLDLIPGFLRLLRKAYRLRYPDDPNEGFNIVLNQAKILCQLDRSVFELVKRFVMSVHGKTIPTVLEEAILKNETNPPSLFGKK